jgi:hypothetical protein
VLEPPFDSDRDVGEVWFLPARRLEFAVHDDATGGPIAGAVAISGEVASVPSRDTGIGEVLVVGPDDELWFTAPGYAPRSVVASVGRAGPVRVGLLRGVRLDVTIDAERGGAAAEVGLRISTAEGPIWDQASTPPTRRAGRPVACRDVSSEGRKAIEIAPNAGGKFVIPGLRPAVLYRVDAIDLLGEAIASADVVLAAQEWRDLRLRTERPSRVWHALVQSEDGRPLQGAWMALLGRDGPRLLLETRTGGRLQVGGIWSAQVPALVTKEGFAATFEPELAAGAPERPTVVRLLRGRTVDLDVEHEDGTPAEVGAVQAMLAGCPIMEGLRTGPSSFRFDHLPDGPVLLRARILGAAPEVAARPGATRVALVVPRTGSVRVHVTGSDLRDGRLRVRLTSWGGARADVLVGASRTSPGAPPTIALDDVPCGDYRIVLEKEAATDGGWSEVGAPLVLRIQDDQTINLRL